MIPKKYLSKAKKEFAYLPQEFLIEIDKYKHPKILDIGTGTYNTIRTLQKEGIVADYHASDIHQYHKPDIPLTFHKIKPDNIKIKGKYDIILLMVVIEHLKDPVKAMIDIKSMLNPGGILLMSYPTLNCLNCPNSTFSFWQDYTHIRPYPKSSIKNLLNDTGYTDIHVFNSTNPKSILLIPYYMIKGIWNADCRGLLYNAFKPLLSYSISKKKCS